MASYMFVACLSYCSSWAYLPSRNRDHFFPDAVLCYRKLINFWYFIVLCGKFGSSYLGKAQLLQEQHNPFVSVCAVFLCVQTMAWLQAFGILTCVQMLMHAIVHGGCRGATRESALGVDSRREIRCHTGDPNPCQYCAWLFSQMLYQLSYPGPTAYAQGWRNACQIWSVQHVYFLCHGLISVGTPVALYQTLLLAVVFFCFCFVLSRSKGRDIKKNHHL